MVKYGETIYGRHMALLFSFRGKLGKCFKMSSAVFFFFFFCPSMLCKITKYVYRFEEMFFFRSSFVISLELFRKCVTDKKVTYGIDHM